MLKRREESYTCLTHICRHHWSEKKPVKTEEISGAFIKYSPFRLNNTGDMQHPYLIPLQVSTLLVSPWLRCNFTLCPKYKLRISRRCLQLMPIFLNISSSWVQSAWSKVFCQSMKQRHISSLTSPTLSDIFLINPILI